MRVLPVLAKLSIGKAFIVVAAAAMLAAAARPAAEDWPTRPITLVVSFAPGAIMDYLGRAIAHDLTTALGQPVVVENKVGGGGSVPAVAIAKAAPDGYTLLMTAIGPAVFRPIMDKSVGYDIDKDFTPIILAGDSPNVLLANPKLGLNTVKDLLAYAKTRNGKLSIAHSGPGTMGHLCSVLFASQAHINGSFIAYRGAAPMITDLLGGQIDIGFPAFGPGSQSVKILAVTTEERVDFLPDVPTMKESGFDSSRLDLERDLRARQCAARDRHQAQHRDQCLSAKAGDAAAVQQGWAACPGWHAGAPERNGGAGPRQVVADYRAPQCRSREVVGGCSFD